MSAILIVVFVLKFLIPILFSVLFRAFGLGYRNRKRLLIGMSVFLLYCSIVPAILIITMGYGEFTHISPIIMIIGSLSVLFFTTDSIGKTIFLQMTQGCMNTVISVILNLIRTLLGLSYPSLLLMILIVYPLVYWFALKYWAKPLRFMADNIRTEIPFLIAIPTLTTVVVNFLPVYPEQNFSHHPVYVTVMMLLVEGIYFFFLYSFYRNLLKIRELLKDEAKSLILESEFAVYQESLERARATRHDLHHHNAVLLELLENDKVTNAIEYLHANDVTITQSKLKQYTSNSVANAVLRIYSRQAQAKQIAFHVQADIQENVKLSSSEFGALLSNLLENAVEASEKVAVDKRQIRITAKAQEQKLKLEISNVVEGKVQFQDNLPISTKVGGGTGTRSIQQIVKKYGGMLRFKQDGEVFYVQIILPL